MIPSKRLNRSIWLIDGILEGTTKPDLSWPESNGNEEIFNIPQTSRL